jgi:hypothetical protein
MWEKLIIKTMNEEANDSNDENEEKKEEEKEQINK